MKATYQYFPMVLCFSTFYKAKYLTFLGGNERYFFK